MKRYEAKRKKQNTFAEIALGISLLLTSFSLFSIAFGLDLNFSENRYLKEIFTKEKIPEKSSSNFFAFEDTQKPKEYRAHNIELLKSINANSFLVGDLDTGQIIFERKAHTVFPIASITKFMTAYTAATILEPNEVTKITKESLLVEGNRGRFQIGDNFTVRDLIYPLLLVSSNDAGEIIASLRDRKQFLENMNILSKNKGLLNTNFDDPTGLSRNNVSTGRDLFSMMRIIHKEFPQIIKISQLSFKENGKYLWRNINKAAKHPEFRGGKTGYTNAARQTSIGYYQIKIANDEVKNIAIIILQSNTRQQDTQNILDYLKKQVSFI